MHEDGHDLKWLVGLGVDGASVMVGKNHSVSTILKQSVPHLTVVRCISHSLAKVASHAVAKLPSYLEFIVSEIYNHFSRFTLRRQEYGQLHETNEG